MIEEIIRKRSRMEEVILNAVNEFQKETGMIVSEISTTEAYKTSSFGGGYLISAKVMTEISLP